MLVRLVGDRRSRRLIGLGAVVVVGLAVALAAHSSGAEAGVAVGLIGLVALGGIAISMACVAVRPSTEKPAKGPRTKHRTASPPVTQRPAVTTVLVSGDEQVAGQLAAMRQEIAYLTETVDRLRSAQRST